jgi:hypothetical protein
MSDRLRPDSSPEVGILTYCADQECDRFEAGWKAGQRPRIEDHLPAVPGPQRPTLLRELILLEIDYRRLGGEQPATAEFLARFPFLDRTWLDRELETVPAVSLGASAGSPAVNRSIESTAREKWGGPLPDQSGCEEGSASGLESIKRSRPRMLLELGLAVFVGVMLATVIWLIGNRWQR